MKVANFNKDNLSFIFAATIFLLLIIFPLFPSNPKASSMFAILVLIGIFWILEVLPIGITALLPLIFSPIFKIESFNEVSSNYFNSSIFLFFGGFILSIAIEETALHLQIAKGMINLLGITKKGVLLSFIFSPFLLSMFISNTSTTLIVFPIALSVGNYFKVFLSEENYNNFTKALLFAIAYSSSIGGSVTLIGTPPNIIFYKIYQISFPNLPEISFASYLFMVFPLALLMSFVLFLVLNVFYLRKIPKKLIQDGKDNNFVLKIGMLTQPQKIVAIIFVITCFLWIFRTDIVIGKFHIPGWSNIIGMENFIDDGTVAIFSVFLLYFWSYKGETGRKKILEISSIRKVPWEIILLFGGGFAISNGFEKSGLSDAIASQISSLVCIHHLLLIIIVCFLIVSLTEFSSNTAVASTFLPIIATVSAGLGIPPIKLMIPATISSSYAFMLPISTPPNAIVFSTGKIKLLEMAKVGIILNLVGLVLVSVYFYYLF